MHGVVGRNEGFIIEGGDDRGLNGEVSSGEVGGGGDMVVVAVFSGDGGFVDLKTEAGVG